MKKINWENEPSTATPINADNLNLMQNNIEEGIDEINTLVNGDIIYQNDNGISLGSFTVSNEISKYKKLVFYGKGTESEWSGLNGVKIGECLTTASEVGLSLIRPRSINVFILFADLTISGNGFTFFTNGRLTFPASSRDESVKLAITKIVGYN